MLHRAVRGTLTLVNRARGPDGCRTPLIPPSPWHVQALEPSVAPASNAAPRYPARCAIAASVAAT